MDITIDRIILTSAIKAVRGFLPSRPTNPSLGHLLLGINGSELLVTAGDGNSFARCSRALRAAQDSATVLIDGQVLDKLLTATGDVVTLTPEGSTCTVKIGRSKYKLGILDPANYPRLDFGGELLDLCDGMSFKAAIAGVADFAQGREAGYQKYVLIRAGNGTLDFVCGSGTQGIAVYRVDGANTALTINVLMLPDDLKAFAASVDADTDMVKVGKDGHLRYNSLDMQGATVDSTYPDYNAPLKIEPQAKINVSKDALSDAVGRLLNLYSDGMVRSVYLDMVPGVEDLTLTIPKGQVGSGEELVPANLALGGFESCGMDIVGLSRILKSITPGQLTLSSLGGNAYKLVSGTDSGHVVLWAGTVKN